MPENEMVEVFRGNDAILYDENRRGRLRVPQRNRHAQPNGVEKAHPGKLEFTLQVAKTSVPKSKVNYLLDFAASRSFYRPLTVAYQENDIRFDIIKAALQTLF